MRNCILFLTFAFGFCGAATRGRGPLLRRHSYTQVHMGVPVRLVVYASSQAVAERACKAAFQRIAQLDDALSDYKPDSELNRLCARAGGPPVPIGEDLFVVLKQAQEIAARSEGAFDVTSGPLVRLWRTARKTGLRPEAEALREAQTRVGWRKLLLHEQPRSAQLLVPRMQLDLGGIAKGYAGDCALAVLREQLGTGRASALIDAGGDLVLGDAPPGQEGWPIETFTGVRRFTGCGVSTSGDSEQFVELDGQRYSHVVDPRTGLGLTHRMTVTVIARTGMVSDALSTAIGVLGEEKGRTLAQLYPGTEVMVRKVGPSS